jgi:hypothetical protein
MGLMDLFGLSKPEPKSEPMPIGELIQMITKRAERLDPRQQAETFVSLGGVEKALLNPDNRIIFGRRGTGKTHLLSFVADAARKRGETAIFLDLRTMGSGSYLYSDPTVSLSEAASRVLRDFVAAIHSLLLEEVTAPSARHNLSRLSPKLDALSNAVREIIVRETVELKNTEAGAARTTVGGEGSAKVSLVELQGEAKGKIERERSKDTSVSKVEHGHVRLSVNMGGVHTALADISQVVGHRIWLLIDEWSTLPELLQPFLADIIKRSLFPHRMYSVHIAAIEHRSNFRSDDGIIGLELGSDLSADINLDDYLVFDNDPERSIAFFKEMLFRHLSTASEGNSPVPDASEFIRSAFTQENSFRELVRACEGVPRDAINIIQIAAIKAGGSTISIPNVRDAAKDWYQRDKAAYLNSSSEAQELLTWIIQKVIGERKARAFLLQTNVRNAILERLFDERLLHIAKRSYSAKADPGTRYRVWKIDYGCYVDLINTAASPTSFLPQESYNWATAELVVPEDDFRAIRRAVLNLAEFQSTQPAAEKGSSSSGS